MIACAHCDRTLANENALYQHTKAKHPGKKKARRPEPAREKSMADELVDGLLEAAMGGEVDDYLVDMFPDQFDDARGA